MVNATSGSLVVRKTDYFFIPEGLEKEFDYMTTIFSMNFSGWNGKAKNMSMEELAEELGPWAFAIAFLYPDEVENLLLEDDKDPLGFAMDMFYEEAKSNPELYGLKPHTEYHPSIVEDAAEQLFFENAHQYVQDCGGGEEQYELNWYAFVHDLTENLKRQRIIHLITQDGRMEDFESYLFPQKEVW